MTEGLPEWLQWIGAHPLLAQALLFGVAMLDALFLIGAFIPAGIVLFGMGALVALGAAELWPTLASAASGALVGDTLSFWLGHRYRHRLFEWRVLKRHPELIDNGRRFFARHGGKGLLLARFLGPVRAITPALAGASGMRLSYFVAVDAVAAAAWSLVYVMPGAVFGASLGLAAEVAGRLAVLMLVLVLVAWLTVSGTLVAVRELQGHAEKWIGAMLDWSRRHRALGRFGVALADPDQPETPALALLALVLLAVAGAWLYLWGAPGLHPYPTPVDAAVFQTLRELHTPWGLELAQALMQLGTWPVYGPVALVAFIALLLARKPHAAAHWVGAIGFGAIVSLGVYFIPTLPPPFEFFGTPAPADSAARDLVLATVTYAFMPVLLSTRRPLPLRVLFYGASLIVLLLVVLAQLYVGAQWYTLAMSSVVIGVLWTALLGLGYRRHGPEVVQAGTFVLPVIAAFLSAAIVQWQRTPPAATAATYPDEVIAASVWIRNGYRLLPTQRQDIAGRPKQPFNLQWAGAPDGIEARLRAAGWQDTAPVAATSALRWLSGRAPVADLPLLPQVHAGLHPVLVLRRPIDEERQHLLRLWPSRVRLEDGAPIHVGGIYAQRARSFYRFLRYPQADTGAVPMATLVEALPGVEHRRAGTVWLLRSAGD